MYQTIENHPWLYMLNQKPFLISSTDDILLTNTTDRSQISTAQEITESEESFTTNIVSETSAISDYNMTEFATESLNMDPVIHKDSGLAFSVWQGFLDLFLLSADDMHPHNLLLSSGNKVFNEINYNTCAIAKTFNKFRQVHANFTKTSARMDQHSAGPYW